MLNLNKGTKTKPKQLILKNCSLCTTVVHNTAQNITVPIIFPLVLHTTIRAQMMSTGGEGELRGQLARVSNRSTRMISSRFPGNSLIKIKYTLQFFFEAVSKLNEEACGDRHNPTPITRSIGELVDTYRYY